MEGVKFHIDKLEVLLMINQLTMNRPYMVELLQLTMRLVDNESLDPKEVEEALKEEMEQLFSQFETEGTLYDCEG